MLNMLAMYLIASVAQSPTEQPGSFPIGENDFGDWRGEIRTNIDWEDGQPWFQSAVCTLTNSPVSMRFIREVESGGPPYPVFSFDARAIAESGQVESDQLETMTVTIGSRSFQLDHIPWRQWAPFSNYGYRPNETIMLAYGISYSAFRESPNDPWLPTGMLLGPMMDADEMRIHFRGSRDLASDSSSNREAVYGHVDVDISGLREAARWCLEGLRSDDVSVLPTSIRGAGTSR